MLTDLRRPLENVLDATGLGNLTNIIADRYCIVTMAAFTKEAVKALWVKIVFDLSSQGLVNGVLDVPMIQINDKSAVIWVKDLQIICTNQSEQIPEADLMVIALQSPILPPAVCLAIGGPSGVGKTTLIKMLCNSQIGHRVRRYIAHTTRPRRSHEIHGIDYFFVNPVDFEAYRSSPRFINFVEARGYWYWSDPIAFFESRWQERNLIHIFAITQTYEFIERRRVIPDLLWVWLDASETELRRRLEKRGDIDIEKSIDQNQRLMRQDRIGLINLKLDMEARDLDVPLDSLLNFIASAERKPI